MAGILPEGVVINSPEVQDAIERINTPFTTEEIAGFWKTYATASRRLPAPTAKRLENLWWRVWGSPRCHLKAVTIAPTFAFVSKEKALVPLRGTANRHERSPLEDPRLQEDAQNPNVQALQSDRPRASASFLSTVQASVSSEAISTARGVVPRPILKKTTSLSAEGPAAFISTHGLSEEKPSDPTKKRVVFETPSKSVPWPKGPKLAPPSSGKKKGQPFVASSATKRTRPVLARRRSSSNSVTSGPSHSPAGLSTCSTAPSRFPASLRTHISPKEKATPSKPSGKASSAWRKADSSTIPRNENDPPEMPSKSAKGAKDFLQGSAIEGPTDVVRAQEPRQGEVLPTTGSTARALSSQEPEDVRVQNALLAEFNMSIRNSATRATPQSRIAACQITSPINGENISTIHKNLSEAPRKSRRSKSDGNLVTRRLLPDTYQVKSRASLAPTFTLASGRLELGHPTVDSVLEESAMVFDVDMASNIDKVGARHSEDRSRSRKLTKVSIPSTISEEPIASEASKSIEDDQTNVLKMSRSKSQLTSLLEKDTASRGASSSIKHGRGGDKG